MASFKEWLDERNISPEEAATIFGKSVGTIRNWRSAGVPDLLRGWVEQRMAELTIQAGNTPERISLEITREQFTAWNRAALLEGKIIYDWAADVLDEAAADAGEDSTGSSLPFNPLSSLKVAEPGTPYGQD